MPWFSKVIYCFHEVSLHFYPYKDLLLISIAF